LFRIDYDQTGLYSQGMATTKSERSARDRLLDAADELFYAEGVHTVGIDRVIEKAGVAKASLYGTFGSKEELVCAYLEKRKGEREARIAARLAPLTDPREKILAVFDALEERTAEPTFRGCAFVNATAEGPRDEGKARPVALAMRAWVRDLFTSLARELGADDAPKLGRQLQVLYDGAMTGASMEGDRRLVADARAMAASLIGAKARRSAPRSGRR
jgi:AcrR family transcriptional regulator